MSDNRTTELREKLTERGVEWRSKNEELGLNLDCFHDTRWQANGVLWCFTELGDNMCLTMCGEWKGCTPEQAIAVTLGEKPRDRTEEWLLKACNQATQDYVAQLEQEVNELKGKLEAATLGSDASAVRLAERFHDIADEMRNMGASTMTPHELLACYAREVDKVADSLMFAATLGSEREKALEKLVQKALDECWCDEWWYEDARKLGLEANY